MKNLLVRIFLRLLNTNFLNSTPCRYDFVGNVDNFSRQDIESTLKVEPDMTLRHYLENRGPLQSLSDFARGSDRDRARRFVHQKR